MTAHIAFEHVTFHWPASAKAATGGSGFSHIHFALSKGDFALLCGPSGEGKTTLLRLLVRLEEPQQGRILHAGQDIRTLAPALLRQRIALVQQTPVMGASAVREALLLPFTFTANAHLPRPTEARLRDMLKKVHLDGTILDAQAENLSLGQKQRIALSRALLLNPEILLLDEPTSALDAESRQAVETQIEAAHAAGTTVFMITHTGYRPPCPAREFFLRGGTLTERTENPHD